MPEVILQTWRSWSHKTRVAVVAGLVALSIAIVAAAVHTTGNGHVKGTVDAWMNSICKEGSRNPVRVWPDQRSGEECTAKNSSTRIYRAGFMQDNATWLDLTVSPMVAYFWFADGSDREYSKGPLIEVIFVRKIDYAALKPLERFGDIVAIGPAARAS